MEMEKYADTNNITKDSTDIDTCNTNNMDDDYDNNNNDDDDDDDDDIDQMDVEWIDPPVTSNVNKTHVVQQNIELRRLMTRDKRTKKDVPSHLYFQTGSYFGLFSEYDQDGFPLRHSDGTRISNTQSKKLMKIFIRHIKDYNKRKDKKQ
jgi:hypothetical protein